MSWPFCVIYFPEKDNRPHIGENQILWYISPPLRKNNEFKFGLFPFIRAKSRFAPLRSGVDFLTSPGHLLASGDGVRYRFQLRGKLFFGDIH